MTEYSTHTREDVLNEFAMDFEPGAGVLQRYLSRYPEYSLHLVDLARELSREFDDESPLSADDLAAVDAGMRRLQNASISLQALQTAPAKTFTDAVKKLGLPIQVGIALRECRIEASTVSSRALSKLAQALEAPADVLLAYMALSPQTSHRRASKSSIKPVAAEKVSLERILREAGCDEDALSKFLNDE
jgi:uncharacterized protein (DUF2384 family)